jgi:hypothetical protein
MSLSPLDFDLNLNNSTLYFYTEFGNSTESLIPNMDPIDLPQYPDMCNPEDFPVDPEPNQAQKHLNMAFLFIVNGLGITVVAILGVIGNILSAVVLSRPQMRSSVTCLLIGLTFCDSLLVFLSILIFGLPAISDFTGTLKTYRHVFYPLWVPYFYPISITGKRLYLILIKRHFVNIYTNFCSWIPASWF